MAIYDDAQDTRKRLKAEREAEKRKQSLRDVAVRNLFSTVEGREYLFWLLQTGRALGQNPYRRNPYDTAFSCGEQNVGQMLMAHMIDVNPSAFAEMLKELTNAAGSFTDSSRRDEPSPDASSFDAGRSRDAAEPERADEPDAGIDIYR